MGNSADRAWQLSQLVEGVSTACNPSHGSLSYVQAGHCVSKQIGRHDAACQGCPRCVSRSPVLGPPQSRTALGERRSSVVIELSCLHGSERYAACFAGSSRAPCAFPNLRCYPRCWLFSCLGLWSHPHISPKEHQKERCGHYSAAALLHYVLWCASEYSVVGRISCYVSHDSIGTNVCQRSFADFFFANCKCKLDTRMNKNCSAEAGLGCLAASTAGAVKDAAGKAEPVP